MVADDISVFEAAVAHDLVVLRIDAVVPSYDVSEAQSERIVSVRFLYERGDVIRMFLKFREFATLADLRVGDDDEIVAGVVLFISFDEEIVFSDIIRYLLIEKGLSLQCR